MNGVGHFANGQVTSADDSVSISDVKRQFDAAVNVIRNLPATPSKDGEFLFIILPTTLPNNRLSAPFQPSDELRLRFYAFYKQATEGPNNTPKPAFYDLVGKYKWAAWTNLGQMSKIEAMKGYINELKKVCFSFTCL